MLTQTLANGAVPDNWSIRDQAARWNPVLAVLASGLVWALFGLPFLRVAPNRLVSGEAVSFISILQGPAWLLAVTLVLITLAAFLKPRRELLWPVATLSCVLIAGLVWLAGAHASFVAQTASPIARTSLGGGFWAALLLSGLIAADALRRSGTRTTLIAALLLPVGFMLATGWCDDLSIMKEYANRSDLFMQALARHIQIVLVALLPTLCIGLPLGCLAHRNSAVGRVVFPLLNVIQTIPSIALFGLLMAPLAMLAAAWPVLGKAGISGVGLAPGVIALTLYSLLPVVRGTLTGLQQLASSVIDAANGMGMTRAQIFWRVEVPLASPVVLAGIRTATIQSVGLAAVTALIGAGGLGAIMFEGLFSSAQDLVLLGVLPIIALGVLADVAFTALISLVSQKQSPQGPQA